MAKKPFGGKSLPPKRSVLSPKEAPKLKAPGEKARRPPRVAASGAFGEPGAEPDLVDLDGLNYDPDRAELQESAGSEPEQDSPGDESILEQEEAYEGISSEQLPSEKDANHGKSGPKDKAD